MGSRSYWLEDALGKDLSETAPACAGDERADVVVLGGGYVGLWTAIQIKRAEPSRDVAILEKDICGGGASGRNGGFVLSWWPKISSLGAILGQQEAVQIARDSVMAIDELEKFCLENRVEFQRSPWLWTATTQAQEGAWDPVVRAVRELGEDVFEVLSSAEVARRSGSDIHRAGVLDRTTATVHPGQLVRALRRVALQLGVRIYENTRVTGFTRRQPIVVRMRHARMFAAKLVIANNAWAAGIREFSRSIVAITSDMIVTAPAREEISATGWAGPECITDSQTMVDYYRKTRDHRIAFGKGGWGIAYGGRLGPNFDQDERRARFVEADFRRYYPKLSRVPITHHWAGPVDRTPNSLPLLGQLLRCPDISYGVGWSGNGVGPSILGGKILASLVLERDDHWSRYPLLGKEAGRFPAEPIRYFGAHLVRSAVARKERAEMLGRRPSFWARKVASLAPAGFEDKG